jgi:multiple sugar transport system permease protein
MSAIGIPRGRRLLLAAGHRLLILGFLAFALLPLYWLVKISLTPDKLLYTEGVALWPSRMTLANFDFVLLNSMFPTFFLNSVIVSLGTAAVVTVLAAGAGYAFSRFRFRGRYALMFVLLLTQMFPLVMLIAPIYRLMAPLGLTDNLIGLIIVYTAFNTPFASFLMQSFFDGIPKDLEEAAMIDGCTRLMALRRVILPLTLPGLGATLGFVFTAAWSELLFALMLINSDSQKTFAVGLLTFVTKFSVGWGQMMAASVLALIPAVLFFVFIQRYLVQGLTTGAVKG